MILNHLLEQQQENSVKIASAYRHKVRWGRALRTISVASPQESSSFLWASHHCDDGKKEREIWRK